MKIAVMSDIHANIHALEAVLADATEKGAAEFWNLGNSVSFGVFHAEVLSVLDSELIHSSVGSYDLMVMQSSSKTKKLKKKDIEKGRKMGFIKRHLSGHEKRFLESLPDRRNTVVEGHSILAVHGSLEPLLSFVNDQSSPDEISGIIDVLNKDALIAWLPGAPFVMKNNDKLFVNPGSIGLSDDGDPRPSYCLLEVSEGILSATIERVEYDVEAAVFQSAEKGAPDIYSDLLISGRRKAKSLKKAVMEDYLSAAKGLAFRNLWEEGHSLQVMRLSEIIFSELSSLHCLSEKELVILKAASILHDIGLRKGVKGHHKASMKMIINSSLRPFTEKEKIIVALVSRYHRKALPSKRHGHFSSLDSSDRNIVEILSSIIRVADGLDRTHRNIIEKIVCEISPETIEFFCSFGSDAHNELEYGLRKSDLMHQVFGRKIDIKSVEVEKTSIAL